MRIDEERPPSEHGLPNEEVVRNEEGVFLPDPERERLEDPLPQEEDPHYDTEEQEEEADAEDMNRIPRGTPNE